MLGHVVLRLEDAGVAAVQRPVVVEVVDQARVGGHDTGFGALAFGVVNGRVEVVGLDGVFPVGDAGTQDQRKRIRGTQAHAAVACGLFFAEVHAAGGGNVRALRRLAVPGVDVRHRTVPALVAPHFIPIGAVIGVLLAVADDCVVLAAQQVEAAGGVEVEALLHRFGFPAPGPQVDAGAGRRVRVTAGGIADHFIVFVARLVEGQLGLPALGQLLFQRGEAGHEMALGIRPGGTGAVRARPVGQGAVLVVQGQATARMVVDIEILGVHAHGQQGVGGQVGLDDAVEDFPAFVEAVDIGLVVLVGAHQAATNVAAFGQRAAGVELGTLVVPGAALDREAGLRNVGRALAHHVHCCAGGTDAVGQAGGALDDFDSVIQRHVVALHGRAVVAVEQLHAIDLEVFHGKAAGIDNAAVGATVAALVDCQPRRLPYHFGQVGDVLVVHALARDHTDRLRRFPYRQGQTGGGAGGTRGVRAGTFGGGAQALFVEVGRGQLHGADRVRSRCRLCGIRCNHFLLLRRHGLSKGRRSGKHGGQGHGQGYPKHCSMDGGAQWIRQGSATQPGVARGSLERHDGVLHSFGWWQHSIGALIQERMRIGTINALSKKYFLPVANGWFCPTFQRIETRKVLHPVKR
ncbi:hypothetical protein D3C76_659560 [compost metagenome]